MMIDPRNWTAEVWAAIAAIASAVAAISSVRWQKRATLEATSPELVLSGFRTADEGGTRHIWADTVKNVGTGVANAVFATIPPVGKRTGLPVGGSQFMAVIQPGAESPLQFEIMMKEPVSVDGWAVGSVSAVVTCWDVLGWRHDFHYSFFVSNSELHMTTPLVPGLSISSRFHVRTSPFRQSPDVRLPTVMKLLSRKP